ncbi:MAG: alpha-L-rhamnosidase [Phycisphaeraceae bacterium]|nr:alpha-L-rhamnosidase [Phycisphaeraceae bacterium]
MSFEFKCAYWIWHGDEHGNNDYRELQQSFEITSRQLEQMNAGQAVTLWITADALYQVWINGHMLGHGPAKSAKGTRGVDRYDISPFLVEGENRLDAVVLNIGTGTMCYLHGLPGVCFEVCQNEQVLVASGHQTRMRTAVGRKRQTVRRWILPCLEDVNADVPDEPWQFATAVDRSMKLYRRRVPLPTREPLWPQRVICADPVQLPDFAISFCHKHYLVSDEQRIRQNTFDSPAYIVTDIHSPVSQTLQFTPTRGAVDWYFDGKLIVEGSGWEPWQQKDHSLATILLDSGANRLVGIHKHDHFTEINLAGFCQQPIQFANPFGVGGFQVVPLAEQPVDSKRLLEVDWDLLKSGMPVMDPMHTMIDANAQDMILGARVLPEQPHSFDDLLKCSASEPWILLPAPDGKAIRVVVDLGMVHNGYLTFKARGCAGSRLIFSFFEGLESGPPMKLHWTYGCENALTYHLTDGYQTFESFHPYGVRYIAIHHTGDHPVELSGLCILTANCVSRQQGALHCSDPMLNAIYNLAVQTVISSVDDTFTDCPTYEQVNWNFDNRMAFLGEILTCANTKITRHSIELFAEDPELTGLVRSQYPSSWDSLIPLWSLHWIMWCRDYFEMTGDRDFVCRLFPRIESGIEEALSHIGSQGLFEWEGVWHFVEWGHGRDDNHAINSAEQACLVGSLDAAIDMAEILNINPDPDWQIARKRLIYAINEHLWDENKQAYYDSLHVDGMRSTVTSQTTNAMMGLYGIATEDRARELAVRIEANDPNLLAYGSPYGLYYILELYDRFQMVEPIFEVIRQRWGQMVHAGDYTAWEHFAEYGGHMGFPTRSRCHPFAAYVVKYFIKYLLGVQRQSTGFATYCFTPIPPQGIEFCHGIVPTSEGIVRVGWQRKDANGHEIIKKYNNCGNSHGKM